MLIYLKEARFNPTPAYKANDQDKTYKTYNQYKQSGSQSMRNIWLAIHKP